ncbi:MAG: tRNA pseudouridine(38-40) synthase TruA [Acidobacteria bacterium]|jgi:tRNA pseudouridine38-40 synthase|nr:tRNA pseudouridine(38-40) synthase TruA [Acidobacteriota bacterium]
MRVLRLLVAYDGTHYCGWQRQENGPTIQGALEDACASLLGPSPSVTGAGRTDAGVHALGQVASVRVETTHATDAVRRALNVRLDPDIRVLDVTDAAPEFHARFDATGKTYRYRIATTPLVSPFTHRYVWHVPQPLDLTAMRRAATDLIGRHDFSAVRSTGSEVSDAVRTLDRVEWIERAGELVLEVHGDGFLRHMVRAIVGTLVEVGSGRRTAQSIPGLLASRDRGQAGETAPAQGLTLVSVDYA